jgi:hypothetical protein
MADDQNGGDRKGKPENLFPPTKTLVALEQAVTRLMNENAAYREGQERLQILVRKRAPRADGLTHPEVIRHVLDERDATERVLAEHRETMKKAKASLLAGNTKEAYNTLNLFLLAPLVINK